MPKYVLRLNRCLNKFHKFEGLRILVRVEREIKSVLFLKLSAQEWGGSDLWSSGRRQVVESDGFDVQKLFQCRLAGASAG